MSSAYQELLGFLREASTLGSVAALAGWDQETMMPPRAVGFRAEQLGLLGKLAHQRATAPRVGELIAECEADHSLIESPVVVSNLASIRRDYDRAVRLPSSLVEEFGRTGSLAQQAWKEARSGNDFAAFLPWLEKVLELNRARADCYGTPPGGEPYDALLEDYEPDMRATELEAIFEPLRSELGTLVADLSRATRTPRRDVMDVEVPLDRQRALCESVLASVGFDMQAGRLDMSTHPFSSGIAPGDTRLTTRYSANMFPESLSSTLHEAGHALYEQGLPKDRHWGEPISEALSLGIHESQSRMWENQVGRSRAFWRWAMGPAREIIGDSIDGYTAEDLFSAVNAVTPGLIRVESDEVTYNLHIMIRFDLERAMLRGDLSPADLPQAWNQRMREDLGVEVPDDSRGCLQDVHWSMGAVGYFPTYTLGNLYAAQLWETILHELPDLESSIERGDFNPLREWLRDRIHVRGRSVPARELCVELTGRPLSHRPLVTYLRHKTGELYGFDPD